MCRSALSQGANPANFGSDLISGDMVELEEMVFIALHRPLLGKRRVRVFFSPRGGTHLNTFRRSIKLCFAPLKLPEDKINISIALGINTDSPAEFFFVII